MKMLATFALIISIAASAAQAGDDLFQAIRDNRLETVKALAGSEAAATARDPNGLTPLMYAAILGSSPIFEELLKNEKVDVNAVSKSGTAALMFAIRNPAMVRILLDRGAAGNAEVVRLLVATGMSHNDKFYQKGVRFLLRNHQYLSASASSRAVMALTHSLEPPTRSGA